MQTKEIKIPIKFEDIKDIYLSEIMQLMHNLEKGTSVQKGSLPEDMNWHFEWTEKEFSGPETWTNKSNWYYRTDPSIKQMMEEGIILGKNTPKDIFPISLKSSKGKWSSSVLIKSIIIPEEIHQYYEREKNARHQHQLQRYQKYLRR